MPDKREILHCCPDNNTRTILRQLLEYLPSLDYWFLQEMDSATKLSFHLANESGSRQSHIGILINERKIIRIDNYWDLAINSLPSLTSVRLPFTEGFSTANFTASTQASFDKDEKISYKHSRHLSAAKNYVEQLTSKDSHRLAMEIIKGGGVDYDLSGEISVEAKKSNKSFLVPRKLDEIISMELILPESIDFASIRQKNLVRKVIVSSKKTDYLLADQQMTEYEKSKTNGLMQSLFGFTPCMDNLQEHGNQLIAILKNILHSDLVSGSPIYPDIGYA